MGGTVSKNNQSSSKSKSSKSKNRTKRKVRKKSKTIVASKETSFKRLLHGILLRDKTFKPSIFPKTILVTLFFEPILNFKMSKKCFSILGENIDFYVNIFHLFEFFSRNYTKFWHKNSNKMSKSKNFLKIEFFGQKVEFLNCAEI